MPDLGCVWTTFEINKEIIETEQPPRKPLPKTYRIWSMRKHYLAVMAGAPQDSDASVVCVCVFFAKQLVCVCVCTNSECNAYVLCNACHAYAILGEWPSCWKTCWIFFHSGNREYCEADGAMYFSLGVRWRDITAGS